MNHGVKLIKILPKIWLNDFLDGNLYLNTSTHFGSIDSSDEVRFDPHDGAYLALQVQEVAIGDEHGNWLPIDGIQNPVTTHTTESEKLNILCLYALTDRKGDSFDPRNLKFGESAVVINDLPEFIARVKRAAVADCKSVELRPVHYVDREIHNGHMGPFRKFSEHIYQNEFRFVFTNGSGRECRLNVGSLRDIVFTIPSANIPSLWKTMLEKWPN